MAARRAAAQHRQEYLSNASGKPRKEPKKRQVTEKTPEDQARENEARQKSRKEISAAIQNARDALDTQVDTLKTQFPGRSTAYFEREVLQTSILSKKKRKPSPWNAYIRSQLNALNEGA